jgi:hypothetical protein
VPAELHEAVLEKTREEAYRAGRADENYSRRELEQQVHEIVRQDRERDRENERERERERQRLMEEARDRRDALRADSRPQIITHVSPSRIRIDNPRDGRGPRYINLEEEEVIESFDRLTVEDLGRRYPRDYDRGVRHRRANSEDLGDRVYVPHVTESRTRRRFTEDSPRTQVAYPSIRETLGREYNPFEPEPYPRR